jgi:transposase InsO family protein
MSLLSTAIVLGLVDSMAILLSQAYQLARARLASAGSPILRLLFQRDQEVTEGDLLRRELDIFRAQRESLPPHRRPDYRPEQRLAILQLRRLRGWSTKNTARHFVLHHNTVRAWIRAAEGKGRPSLLNGAVVWNRIDEAVRWATHELRRLCPEPEFGTRTIARQVLRASVQISRSTVQRVLREPKPVRPPPPARPAMVLPLGKKPHHLLTPKRVNRVWHLDLLSLQIRCFRFTVAAILDGFSRRLLCLRVYPRMPRARDMAALVRRVVKQFGKPRFVITDHGMQFRRQFRSAMNKIGIIPVQARVRAPYLNGKIERAFRTFRVWWRLVLTGLTQRSIQRRLDDFGIWFNEHRAHSALWGRTPQEAWEVRVLPAPVSIRAQDQLQPQIEVRRRHYHGDPRLPVIEISLRLAA